MLRWWWMGRFMFIGRRGVVEEREGEGEEKEELERFLSA